MGAKQFIMFRNDGGILVTDMIIILILENTLTLQSLLYLTGPEMLQSGCADVLSKLSSNLNSLSELCGVVYTCRLNSDDPQSMAKEIARYSTESNRRFNITGFLVASEDG